jgi:cysteine-rich repeat protein
MPNVRRAILSLFLSTFLLPVAEGRAQVIEVPTFPVGPATLPNFGEMNVGVADDGTILFVWSEYVYGSDVNRQAATQWFTSYGLPLHAPRRADSSGHVFFEPVISPDTRGGYVAAWEWIANGSRYEIFGVRLSENGTPVGPDFHVNPDFGGPASWPAAVGLPSGSAIVYAQNGVWAQLYDAAGAPRGDRVQVAGGNPYRLFAEPLPSGGFVVTWVDLFTGVQSWGRAFNGDGAPVGPAFPVSQDGLVRNVAVGPDGRIATLNVEVFYEPGGEDFTEEFWVAQFDESGQPLAAPFFVHRLARNVVERRPDVAYDHFGNLLVIWTWYDPNNPSDRFGPPEGRAFAADGTPFGPAFALADEDAYGIRLARMHERDYRGSGFVAAWTHTSSPGQERGAATIVSLCTPEIGVCGDGVLAPQCEQCDDGVANSDLAPDACRLDCRTARCGDGVIDTGEQCDDSNRVSCDGCSNLCQSEVGGQCGDGMVASTCGETCDDGNALAGDGCSSVCLLERIPGGGSVRTDCHTEWRVNNPANVPFLDRRGSINSEQTCTDNDPACDFDDGLAGSCRFLVGVCVNNTDVPGCARANRLVDWQLDSPSAAQAEARAELAAARDSLYAIGAPMVGVTATNLCSALTAIDVGLRGSAGAYRSGQIKLRTSAVASDDSRDKDRLRLICLPAATN